MREIKFRGKGVITNNWFVGSLITIKDGAIIYSDNFLYEGAVKPETIGQYTGLKDKNDKEIYEGDIILWRNQKYVVKFQSGMFYASVEEFNKDVYGGFPLWSLVKYHDEPDCGVIVGNIYEYKEEEK
jgi:uncharacterized phage protein (TIGR01671 family)